ncbi:MAG TPA: hypothetical protein VFH91_01400 [Pyrinomonadaceae bacterium]|nr:hypothetical protein [Pyrinomonadaceae bacterium]
MSDVLDLRITTTVFTTKRPASGGTQITATRPYGQIRNVVVQWKFKKAIFNTTHEVWLISIARYFVLAWRYSHEESEELDAG